MTALRKNVEFLEKVFLTSPEMSLDKMIDLLEGALLWTETPHE